MANVIQINTPGPQGTSGKDGAKGDPGIITSFNSLVVTGSLFISGGVNEGNVTASLISASGGFTGSLYGTASNATTSSHAITSSYVLSTNVDGTVVSSSHAITSSYVLGTHVDGTVVSASYASSSFTASFATSASFALNVPDISGFPFTGSAEITGSLNVVGPATASEYTSTGTGVPTLSSNSDINLSAKNGRVNITTSSLRLASFQNSETSSISFTAGDMYFNSTINKFIGYNGTSHIILG